ncbi:uncharacterized protein DS421_13g411750 [Arachis hypogaea]|nr:uncharacterized protein DS421_13g411750 [Arachis hypogaea]
MNFFSFLSMVLFFIIPLLSLLIFPILHRSQKVFFFSPYSFSIPTSSFFLFFFSGTLTFL